MRIVHSLCLPKILKVNFKSSNFLCRDIILGLMSISQPNFCLLFLGLQPYTNYSFVLIACTSAGCASSQPLSGQTLQAAPHGKGESHSYRTAKRWSYGLVFPDRLTRCTTPLSSIKLSCTNLHKRICLFWRFCVLPHFLHCLTLHFWFLFVKISPN